MKLFSLLSLIILLISTFTLQAQQTQQGMNNAGLDTILKRLNPKTEGKDGFWQLEFEGYPVQVITDKKSNRMRIIIPITQSEQVDKKLMYRLMQANFDSALDARYAIAKDIMWSTFIHPLSQLDEEQFLSGFAQTVILAKTFGTTYSSGALVFRGGDSSAENQKLFEKILKKGLAI